MNIRTVSLPPVGILNMLLFFSQCRLCYPQLAQQYCMNEVICVYFIYSSAEMVVRAVSQATTLLRLSHLPGRQSLSRDMTSTALDLPPLTRRRSRTSVKACRTEKSGSQPTSRLMIAIVMHRAPSWQLVDKPVKYLAPSQK